MKKKKRVRELRIITARDQIAASVLGQMRCACACCERDKEGASDTYWRHLARKAYETTDILLKEGGRP